MSSRKATSRLTIISWIVRKDLKEYGRDRLWAFLTALVLVAVVALFWVLPDDVDESITIGFSGLGEPAAARLLGDAGDAGLRFVQAADAEQLRAVVAGDLVAWSGPDGFSLLEPDADGPEGASKQPVAIGLAFPPDFESATAAGETTRVDVLVGGDVPPELRSTVEGIVKEMAYGIAGIPLPIDTSNPDEIFVVLGEDRVGDQVTARESFRPMFVFLVLMMEMFVMSSLIAKEIQDRTVTALLVTPARTGDILAAKGISGALSGLVQAVILLLAIDSFGRRPLLVLTLMALGAVMVSGTAMIAGSAGKDFIGTMFYGMVFMIPLLIPAFAALFPGSASVWIRALPSYPLIEGLVGAITYGDGWVESGPRVLTLAAWCVALFGIGWVVLKRRVESI